MFLLQFSGQGVVTFYTAEIFKEAESAVDPNDCALVIGVTYFLSSILGLVLKKHVGRRFLLLASELGMAVSQLAMGIYFYVLSSKFHYHHRGILIIYILYAHHHNLLLNTNCQNVKKTDPLFMAFKKWIQNIQTTGYNGAHMICNTILEPKF